MKLRSFPSSTLFVIAVFLGLSPAISFQTDQQLSSGQWTEAHAADWFAKEPWLVGSNFIPATAINQLEMWRRRMLLALTGRDQCLNSPSRTEI
jgi:hypothetical protein